MSNDDAGAPRSTETRNTKRSLFSVPKPLKQLFDTFPLTTYAENSFPINAVSPGDKHTLYIFTTQDDSKNAAPSFNPSCLRWQTYLKIADIPFQTKSSNNHASPSGALPYLVTNAPTETISVKSLRKWIAKQKTGGLEDSHSARQDAYTALIDGPVRIAWLYQLYLLPANASVVQELYVRPCSSNQFVQLTINHQLKRAADTEIRISSPQPQLQEEDLLRRADEAMSALSTLLGENDWFFASRAGMFDASMFAYTYLLLDEKRMAWGDNKLGALLRKYPNLIDHRDRLMAMYF